MIETEDLYLSAYALACGGALVGAEARTVGGRVMAVFSIDGDLGQAVAAYGRGEAMVNVHVLRVHLRRLKDCAHDAVRAVRAQERTDVVAEGGRVPALVAGGFHRRHRR